MPDYIGDGTACVTDQFGPDPDFRSPGLPSFRNSWYFLSHVKASWKDARDICRRRGGDLVDLSGPPSTIDLGAEGSVLDDDDDDDGEYEDDNDDDNEDDAGSDARSEEDTEEKEKEEEEDLPPDADPSITDEWRHLYNAMSVAPGGPSTFYWLGAQSEGAGAAPWRWANGSAPLERSHASWRDGKPAFGRNKCLLMQDIDSFKIEDSWRDYRCTAKFPFVCEIHIPSNQGLDFGKR